MRGNVMLIFEGVLFSERSRHSFFFSFVFFAFHVLLSVCPLFLFGLFERLAHVEYCEHSPGRAGRRARVIASCIAAGFEIPFVSVWGQLVASVE